jgi:tetratricopeptide (TPR) repeat protein
VSQQLSAVTRAVTFLLTDIEGSTAAWEADADAMAVALARHDEIVEQVMTSRGGRLIKTRGEGDATFSVFDRPSAAAAAAIRDSARLAAWGTCFDGQLSMLIDPEHLDEIESAVAAAAEKLAALDDAAGEAKAHTVRAGCLARLGRIGDCETALDQALTAARRAGELRRVNGVLANAPLAALWGPNPVPRAGGGCLDVVRLLRITAGSPVVEATSTRCQGVLDAFRGRAAAGRQLIDSARRTLTELGMRHALLEVDQFAGIVELVADDPAAAEPYLRRAYKGFHRMGLDADTAETAALLARACLALDRDAEADELCWESERLAGHALKASITWRTVRAQLLAREGAHDEAKRVAEEAVALAGRTDALVDHGDACLALATVLNMAGDAAGARAAAEKAVGLYEQKGAAALAEKARSILSAKPLNIPAAAKQPSVELDNGCIRVIRTLEAAFDREAWGEVEQLYAPDVFIESRRKIVGFKQFDLPSGKWSHQLGRFIEMGWVRHRNDVVAVRGERLALTRLELGSADVSPGAPQVEVLQLFGVDDAGRIVLQVSFDVDDIDAAMAELDAAHARVGDQPSLARLENAASRTTPTV